MSSTRSKDPPAPVMAEDSMIATGSQKRLVPNRNVPVKVQEEEATTVPANNAPVPVLVQESVDVDDLLDLESQEPKEQASTTIIHHSANNNSSNNSKVETFRFIEDDLDQSTLTSYQRNSKDKDTLISHDPSTLTSSAEKSAGLPKGYSKTPSVGTSVETPPPPKRHPHPDDPSIFTQSEYSEPLQDEEEGGDVATPLPPLASRQITDKVIDTARDGSFDRRVSGLTTYFSGYTNRTPDNSTDADNSNSGSKCNTTLWVVIICLLVLVAAVVPIVVCGILGECSSSDSDTSSTMDNTTNAPTTTIAPTNMMTMPPIVTVPPRPGGNNNRPDVLINSTLAGLNFVEVKLGQTDDAPTMLIPDYTMQAFDDPLSPQSKAYLWLIYTANPEQLATMPMWRRQQIFALATFFFAFRGARWNDENKQDWLNVNVNECQWSIDIVCYFEPESETLQMMPPPNNNMNGQGGGGGELQGKVRAIRMLNFVAPIDLASGIPPELELLQYMQMLQLQSLKGLQETTLDYLLPLPQLVNMPQLQTLHLPNNQLIGTLPSELGTLSQLQSLTLTQNQLSGTIPSELGLLTDLQQLWLDDTDLTGVVPEPLCDLTVARDGVDLDIDCEQVTCPTGCNCDCAQQNQEDGAAGGARRLIEW